MRPIDIAIRAYWQSGLSILPINSKTKRPAGYLLPQAHNEQGQPLYYRKEQDGTFSVTTDRTGSPKGTWEPFTERLPTEQEIDRWIAAKVESIAVIGGAISGGVEILDFDVPGFYEAWAELAGTDGEQLPMQRTGGGGTQLAWRCDDPEPNQKLAWAPDSSQHAGRRIAIETRGTHGYALLPPSLHPSGRHYQLLRGRFSAIPHIDASTRNFLLTIAKSLCQAPKTKQELAAEARPVKHREPQPYEGESVIDAFNAHWDIHLLLARYGYTRLQNGRYGRPGKADSAGVAVLEDGKTFHFSSNDPLDSGRSGSNQPRSSFDLFAEYEHNGDYKKAARAAAEQLGMTRKRQDEGQQVLQRYGLA